MTFQQLTYVVEIFKCGSINKAAHKLVLSQSGISTAVRELEEELGIQFFLRSNRGVEFTPEGEEFLSYAISLLEQKRRIEQLYGEGRNAAAPVRFSVSTQRYPFTEDAFLRLLRDAQHNEYEEFDPVYPSCGEAARAEGFPEAAASFEQIARIELTHGNRFGRLADLLENGKLFVSDAKCGWMCLNCGYVLESLEAPRQCPVCSHDQGWFIRLEMAPYSTAPQN